MRRADTDVPASQGVQGLDRYAYVNNDPIRYTDPTGHRIDDGCQTEGCSLSVTQAAHDAQQLAKLNQKVYDRKCKAGNDAYCSTALKHPKDVILFAVNGLTNPVGTVLMSAIEGILGSTAPDPSAGTAAITITPKGLAHVINNHTVEGSNTVNKSIFNSDEDITSLINKADSVSPELQKGGNLQRIVDAGREIGIDRDTDLPTTIYTVITDIWDNLVTAFPGVP